VLGEHEKAPLGAQWALVFLLGPGLFLPIEQEVSRALSERREQGLGGAPVVRRAATIGVGIALAVLVILIAFSKLITDKLFDGQLLLLIGLALGIVGALAGHLTRGSLSGSAKFKAYSVYIGADGLIRVLACALVALAGVKTAGWFGIAVGIAGLLAVPVALRVQRPDLEPGPEAAWQEISRCLAYLLAGTLFAYTLMNAGPVLIKLLATDDESEVAGYFFSAVVIARIPLFLFQAVQASLLPKLTSLASAGRLGDFRVGLRRLVAVVAGLAVLGTIGGYIIGPFVVQMMSGDEHVVVEHRTMGLLAAGSGFYMLALALAQAVIALGGHRRQAVGWCAGVIALFVTTFVSSDDLFLRVELGLLVGSLVSFLVMGYLLMRRLILSGRGAIEVEAGDFIDALHDVAIEP
jgi:O-antigen/teichoic acid export membrane protein